METTALQPAQMRHMSPYLESTAFEGPLYLRISSWQFSQALHLLDSDSVVLNSVTTEGTVTGEIIIHSRGVTVHTTVLVSQDGLFSTSACTCNEIEVCPHGLALVLKLASILAAKKKRRMAKRLFEKSTAKKPLSRRASS